MRKMKLRKIIASATLSVCLATSAVIATTSLNKTGAYAATQTVDTSGIVSTVIKSGNNAAVSYGENVDGTNKAFTGLRLTGSSGAKFDLGTIDLSKSYWNGVDMTYGTEKPASGLSAAAKAEMELKDGSETGDYNKFLYDESTENVNGKYYNGSDTYANFIAFAFAPHVNRYNKTPTDSTLNRNYKELENFTVTLTDVNDSSNFMIINSSEQGDNNLNGRNLGVRGNNQKLAGMRKFSSGGPRIYSGLRVRMFDAGSADQIPYELCYKQNWSATSAAEREPALYSPNGSAAAGTIAGTWLIRKFAKTEYVDNNVGDTAAWNGFSSSKVNVTVTFNNVRTLTDMNDDSLSNNGITSLVITSLGGYDLTVPTQEIDESEIAAGELKVSGQNSATVTYGTDAYIYAPKKAHRFGGSYVTDTETDVYYAGKIINVLTYGLDGKSTAKLTFNKEGIYTLKHKIGSETLTEVIRCESNQIYPTASLASEFNPSEGATATYGEKTVLNAGGGDFYLTSNESAKKTYKGIVLTGGANATFKLDKPIDITQFKWNDPSSFDSLFEFAITPDGKTRAKAAKRDGSEGYWTIALRDLNSLTFIIEDAEDPTQKVTVTYGGSGEVTEDQGTEKSVVSAAANGQAFAAYRENKGGYVASCPKETGFNGNVNNSTKIVFDYKKNSLYSNVEFIGLTGNSYLIRDFNDASKGPAWAGFKSGKVKLTVQFGTLVKEGDKLTNSEAVYGASQGFTGDTTAYRTDGSELTETSIVLTSIAGYDLSKESFAVSHENDIVSYFNQDGTLFDETDKNTTVKTVNDDILLPTVTQSNFINGNIDFDGYYEFIAPSGAVIASGAYANNGVITSDKLLAAGRGTYTLNITDAYNRTKTVEYKVGAVLTAEVGKNATLYLNGKKYSEGEEIIVYNDNVAVRVELNEGYEIEGYKIDDDSCTLINVGGDLYLEANAVKSKHVFRPVVSATKYTISYGFFDSTITDIPESQIFTVETRNDLALTVPTAEGKTFTGWYLNGRKITSGADLKLENVTLTGAFGEERITVTFVVDGEESYGYKFEGGSLTDYVPQKDGYVFEGWFDEDGNKVNLANVAADVKVYAKFTPAGEISTGDKETAGVNDGEATVIDAEIKEPYYIGVVELVSFGLALIGLAGTIVGLVLFLKKKKASAARGIADGAEANADQINEGKGE